MIEELRKKLDTWQQDDGKRASFKVLYSDIGKVWPLFCNLCRPNIFWDPNSIDRCFIRDGDGTLSLPPMSRCLQ